MKKLQLICSDFDKEDFHPNHGIYTLESKGKIDENI